MLQPAVVSLKVFFAHGHLGISQVIPMCRQLPQIFVRGDQFGLLVNAKFSEAGQPIC